jgi:hypothetical protein
VQVQFEKYAKQQKINFVSEVIPYPIDVSLTHKLPGNLKRGDTFKEINSPINVVVPISGAAVGLTYYIELIRELFKLSSRFKFWVLVRKASYTDFFVMMLLRMPGVNIIVGKNDAEMINLYELIYKQNLIHIEITKPSEQAFKAILEPSMVGGSILLFSAPVGRQEVENIEFLRRHKLVKNISVVDPEEALKLRALTLNDSYKNSAKNMMKCILSGVFENMVNDKFKFSEELLSSGEIGSAGAKMFWEAVDKHQA